MRVCVRACVCVCVGLCSYALEYVSLFTVINVIYLSDVVCKHNSRTFIMQHFQPIHNGLAEANAKTKCFPIHVSQLLVIFVQAGECHACSYYIYM